MIRPLHPYGCRRCITPRHIAHDHTSTQRLTTTSPRAQESSAPEALPRHTLSRHTHITGSGNERHAHMNRKEPRGEGGGAHAAHAASTHGPPGRLHTPCVRRPSRSRHTPAPPRPCARERARRLPPPPPPHPVRRARPPPPARRCPRRRLLGAASSRERRGGRRGRARDEREVYGQRRASGSLGRLRARAHCWASGRRPPCGMFGLMAVPRGVRVMGVSLTASTTWPVASRSICTAWMLERAATPLTEST